MGPTAVNRPLTPKKTARARPRSRRSNEEMTTAIAAGTRNAAETPCAMRKTTIQVSATEVVGVAPQRADDTANPTTPTATIRRWPTTSATRPPNANAAASATR